MLSLSSERSKSCSVCVWCGVICHPIIFYPYSIRLFLLRLYTVHTCRTTVLVMYVCTHVLTCGSVTELLKLIHRHDMSLQHKFPIAISIMNGWAVITLSHQCSASVMWISLHCCPVTSLTNNSIVSQKYWKLSISVCITCFFRPVINISRLSSVGRAYDCNRYALIVWSLVRFRQSRRSKPFAENRYFA